MKVRFLFAFHQEVIEQFAFDLNILVDIVLILEVTMIVIRRQSTVSAYQ